MKVNRLKLTFALIGCCLFFWVSYQTLRSYFKERSQNPAIEKQNQRAAAKSETLAETKAKAEDGDAAAQCQLGYFYSVGQGLPKDLVEAAKWFRKSAEQGNADAQVNLGNCCYNGDGVTKDVVAAAKWYRKAAKQDNADAQYYLAMNYEPKALAEGAKWLRLVAERGDMTAQVSLGICYEKGNGVPKDSVEAAKWYRMAAEQGNASGQQLLGFCYAQGQGAPKDYVEAYKWFNLATAQGLDFGDRHELEQQMTAEQIAEAQRLTREFKPRSEQPFSNKRTTDSYPTASGTGFFITDDGYLITNEHVVKDAAQVRLVTSAGLISARVVKVDTANDLALLKADIIRAPQLGFVLDNGVVTKFSSLPIAASRAVKLGGVVVTVGFPNIGLQGFAPKFARGEIASLSGAGDDARYFQISVPVQPGNSGGALVDERGNVVGVVSAKLNAAVALASSGSLPENVNYAVKSSYLLSFLESVPDVSAKLKEATGKEIKFEEVVEKAKQAAVLVLVY